MERFEEFAKAQTEQFNNFQETNRQWLDRVQAETNLASEFVSKLTAARSIPDAMTAYQVWGSRRLEMMAEDTRHLLDNTQKFMQTSARLLANGWQSKAPASAVSFRVILSSFCDGFRIRYEGGSAGKDFDEDSRRISGTGRRMPQMGARSTNERSSRVLLAARSNLA